ncbi:NAD(P)-binding protein [Saccharata proteae CBS 121410]|uniref:NAD(P)-binding protein n=1 Tax=Saccharata proteae CBS 121410 TaxID=1314787 RepID=A0A9P4I3F5_9PEZI|nr:NAD(P)-binding protein [Saccharata proteae CBS 121410]
MSDLWERASNFWNQSFNIPEPTLTARSLPDQTGRVFIVTGGYAGVGFELAKILFEKNGKVYIAGRSKEKAFRAIATIQEDVYTQTGQAFFLQLDLADLSSIKKSAEEFMKREQRLDVLTNNAGVMTPPSGSKTKQGHELQMGTNCLGPFLFTQLLLPVLRRTAANAPAGSVRVTWAASLAIDFSSASGVTFDKDGNVTTLPIQGANYARSKAGNVLLAAQFARRYGDEGLVSASWNPGNLSTELQRHASSIEAWFISWLLYPAKFGAFTELYAGWSPDVGQSTNGCLVVPWGRIQIPRKGLMKATMRPQDGGDGTAEKFWDWCEKETRPFM